MAGNSQRKGAVRKRGKGIGPTGRTAGSGGRVKRGLEGKGPTPKAEDRPYHKAYRKRRPEESPISGNKPRGRRPPMAPPSPTTFPSISRRRCRRRSRPPSTNLLRSLPDV